MDFTHTDFTHGLPTHGHHYTNPISDMFHCVNAFVRPLIRGSVLPHTPSHLHRKYTPLSHRLPHLHNKKLNTLPLLKSPLAPQKICSACGSPTSGFVSGAHPSVGLAYPQLTLTKTSTFGGNSGRSSKHMGAYIHKYY
ncbi:hypothetical protein RUM44_007047 [Polyplax serrata]|uniref:Uncharacterized protein n=1 Tax=Polyplax serrata TaxID=468196 RepID=A0ABR1AZM2_POLSC